MSGSTKNNGEELYCPVSMTRFDPKVNVTIWKCKFCLKHILSKDSVRTHLANCPFTKVIDSITISDSDSIDCNYTNPEPNSVDSITTTTATMPDTDSR